MHDVAIIGGGPAGLSAALMLGRCRRRVVVIDSGKPRNAAARAFHGYLGRDGDDPQGLLERGRQQAAQYGVEFQQDVAVRVERSSSESLHTSFVITTAAGRAVRCRKLLFALQEKDLPAPDGSD